MTELSKKIGSYVFSSHFCESHLLCSALCMFVYQPFLKRGKVCDYDDYYICPKHFLRKVFK